MRKAALSVKSGLEVVTCGSYRRGHSTCGDVDVLITHPDGISHLNIFKPILNQLKTIGKHHNSNILSKYYTLTYHY